jgi:dTDP-glucose 4,6-dehydratase
MNETKTYLVTGGDGFISSNFVLMQRKERHTRVVNLDLLTYAGNPQNLEPLKGDPDYIFVHGDIGDQNQVRNLLQEYCPDGVVNFTAESHVDCSIDGPEDFIKKEHWGRIGKDKEIGIDKNEIVKVKTS